MGSDKQRGEPSAVVTHRGGCHCGRVRFEVEAPAAIEAQLCDCSICSMTAYLHLIVPSDRFRLIEGEGVLETYTFNTGVAQRHFCTVCGIKSFCIPRSNPDGVSVNVRCLDPDTVGIESQYEIDTSAAVPGTDMKIGTREARLGNGRFEISEAK